jgi:precorrin-2 dehydrogenase/sirohydrochlorin ferrochelatase
MRKLPGLLATGARIDLIDPAPLSELPQHPQLTHHRRNYRPTDLGSARLIFAATNDPQVNTLVAANAAERGIPCCRIDSAEDSDFITPARLLRPPLSFSISTGGESPAMASVLRDQLGAMLPPSWQAATGLVAAIRRKVLTERPQIPYNQRVLLQLIEQGLFALIEQTDTAGIDQLLLKHFGAGFTLNDLQFSLSEGTP